MGCISITIGHKTSNGLAIIYYNATDGIRSLYGDQAWGWGGMGTPTDEEYKAQVTPYVLSWFGATVVDLCGYVPPVIPPIISPIIPGINNTVILIVGLVIIYYFFVMRGK